MIVSVARSSQKCVNDARKQLFTQRGGAMDGLPPTQDALTQHIKRAAYQAGYCWAQTMIEVPELHLRLNGVGRRRLREAGKYAGQPYQKATQACRELVRCGCKKGYRGHCKCQKACLQCTALHYSMASKDSDYDYNDYDYDYDDRVLPRPV